jgi:hypothetical protein
MRHVIKLVAIAMVGTSMMGCAGSLNSLQKGELQSFQAKGIAVEEKNPGTGAALGILPGGGSFYTRHYGIGVVNLLLWPISILWDPINGYEASQSINYYLTKAAVERKQNSEIKVLEEQMQDNKITTEEFLMKKREVEKKYAPTY